MIYGYARVSTKKQNIERQIRNIKQYDDNAVIITEEFTGTTLARPKFDKMVKQLQKGDTVIFDSVSRMSRNAEEGFNYYECAFTKGINLVFIKEPHINTETYKKALQSQIQTTGTTVDLILDGINAYLMELARQQIRIALDQAEKEVMDLHQRVSEGIVTARLNGKQIGRTAGTHVTTKKSQKAKEIIKKYNADFDGTLNDIDTMKLVGVARNSYYKYKRELKEEGV